MDFQSFFQDSISVFLYLLRVLVPLLSLLVIIKCYLSVRRGRRKEEPVILLEDMSSHIKLPVLYWENSIGRSKSCDIVLPDQTASRDHAVLMRREIGWIITDTGSKAGTFVNGKRANPSAPVFPGDVIAMGSTALMLRRAENTAQKKGRFSAATGKHAPSPFLLLLTVTFIQAMLAVQACLANSIFNVYPLLPFGALIFMEWGLYFYSTKILKRVSFELETIAFLLCGIGTMTLCLADPDSVPTQLITMFAGIILFCIMIAFMGNLKRVMTYRTFIEIAAILLFAVNLLFGVENYGSKNWISLGPISIQPSEFVKIAFVFAGASTLDKLQTKKNLTEFILFSAICVGSLFLMRDFGTACIFFITFLIIAFMRSGSIRTIVLICAAAVFGVFIILQFKPYIADRFSAWRHVWEYADTSGYQQTRVLTYAASGGLFGVGLGEGYLKNVFAASSDLVFGVICEELGLLLSLATVACIALFLLYARSDVTRSRSTFYSISACAAAGMLLFQTCLNIFGPTDVLPLTGVTLPFISAGGSSMLAVWGLLAFIKASDERTYAVKRKPNKPKG